LLQDSLGTFLSSKSCHTPWPTDVGS
jgi:hypothetical protein